jgi:hypothetical protein
MKKSELKKILKPLVKECIRESLLEDGILSGIISEVARGMRPGSPSATPTPVDPVKERMQRNAFNTEQSTKLQENKKKLMAAIGGEAYNGVDLFEGTTPAPAQTSPTQQSSPMSGQAPGDPGVDISNLFGSVGRSWNAHMNAKDRK